MASEMRRAAKALVATQVETFEARPPVEASKQRLERALAAFGEPRTMRLSGIWKLDEGREVYEATFEPAARTRRFLHAVAAVLVLLIGASAVVLLSPASTPALEFLLPALTALAIVAMPFVVAAAAWRREAEESRLRRLIRATLQDGSR